jgi:hypothetical protein
MNKTSHFLALLLYLALCGALSLCGCTQQVSGTEVGNPATVSGKVCDTQNNAVANAVVFLVVPDYNPVLDSIAPLDSIGNDSELSGLMVIGGDMQRISTRTDDKGEFVLDSVSPHAYNLFITDSVARRIGFRPGIAVNRKQVDLGMCEIRNVGYATIMVHDSVFKQNGYISFPGTLIKKAIDSAGQYTVPIIYDSMTINYYGESGDSLSSIIRNQPVSDVNSGDTVDLTGIETIIIPPVVVAIIGNDTLYSPIDSIEAHDTLVHIVARGATINKNSLIEYQFYEATQKILSTWNTDNNYSLLIRGDLEYSVACRVRSKSNTSIVTAWTPGLLIKMKRRPPDTIFIPTPSVPIVLDTFQFVDSISYRFLVRSPVNVDTFTFDYRLGWSDTVSDSGFSSWNQDTIISIQFPAPGKYIIRAQMRSVIDTSQMSLWSDSLLFTVSP